MSPTYSNPVHGLRRSHLEQIAAYEAMMWGACLSERQALNLRGLARVFDVDAGPDVPLPRLWSTLKPLLEALGAQTSLL
jgi:hypothetical protein